MRRHFIIFTAALTLCASTALAQESSVEDAQPIAPDHQAGQFLVTEDSQSPEATPNQVESTDVQPAAQEVQPAVVPSENAPQPAESTVVQNPAPAQAVATTASLPDSYYNNIAPEIPVPDEIWKAGIGVYFGIGPAFDLRDPAAGYSARVGLNVHGKYFGIGLDATWNMLWATEPAARSDNQDMAYLVTSSGLLLMLNGYIPATKQFIFKLGAGAGVGRRYELIFSDEGRNDSGTSWLARLEAGAFYIFENHITLGLDLEFNFNNYTEQDYRWWSDCETDISLGVVLSLGYQFVEW